MIEPRVDPYDYPHCWCGAMAKGERCTANDNHEPFNPPTDSSVCPPRAPAAPLQPQPPEDS